MGTSVNGNVALSLVIHLLGIVVWVGGLMTMSRVMVMNAKNPGPARPVLSQLSSRLQIFALSGAVLVLGSGLWQLSMWPEGAFRHTRWMHHKLTALLALAVVHIVMWRTQKRWSGLGQDAPLPRGLASGLHGTTGLLLIVILSLVCFGERHYLHFGAG